MLAVFLDWQNLLTPMCGLGVWPAHCERARPVASAGRLDGRDGGSVAMIWEGETLTSFCP